MPASLWEKSKEFVDYLETHAASLPALSMDDIVARSGGASRVAIIAVNVVAGAYSEVPLAGPRNDLAFAHILRTLRSAEEAGITELALVESCHSLVAARSAQPAAQCAACAVGAAEVKVAPELADFLAGSKLRARAIKLNSLSAVWSPDFIAWEQPLREWEVNTYIVVGNCTDLSIALSALPLRTWAHQEDRPLRLILPADCLETYDLPAARARETGAMAHDAEMMQAVFLYYMSLVGCEVCRTIL